jgi:predicted ABC-type ATPase
MQVILEIDEAWSLMSLIVSQLIDHTGVSGEGKTTLRRWRTDHAVGMVEMDDLALALNEALGNVMDEKTTRMIRRRGRYISSREAGRRADED